MPSQSPRSEREEERRLNVRTLTIASAASASAALVTSQLWIAGTWIAAALTPVLVALIAELLSRPTARISRALTSDRTATFPVADDREPRTSRAPEPDPSAPRPAPRRPDRDRRPGAPREPAPREPAPMRVYRAGAGEPVRPGAGGRSRRKVAVGMVALTAALAFVIAVAVITVPELIAGKSLGQADRGTTFSLGGKSRDKKSTSDDQQQEKNAPTETTTDRTETTTAPEEEQPTETTPPPTTTVPPTTTTLPPAPQAAPPQTTTPP